MTLSLDKVINKNNINKNIQTPKTNNAQAQGTASIFADLGAARLQAGDNFAVNGIGGMDGMNGVQGASSAAILQEIEALKAQKEQNLVQIGKLEQKIEDLMQKAEQKIEEAAEKKSEAIKAHKEECKAVVEEQLKIYEDANKNGDGMSKVMLKHNIKAAFPDAPDLGRALAALLDAEGISNEIKSCASEIKDLVSANEDIDVQIAAKELEYMQALEAEQSSNDSGSDGGDGCSDTSSSSGSDSEDPIGFEYDGKTYDFIKDDGNFDSTSDFLGADKQWEEMAALDKSGDGIVDAEELKAGNIKVVDNEGNISDLAEKFGSDFSIDLNSYDKNGEYAGLDTGDADNDGTANQELLGTFNVNIGSESVQGYNTLDDKDYLSSKFGISNGKEAAGAVSASSEGEAADESSALSKANEAETAARNFDGQINSEKSSISSAEMEAEIETSMMADEAANRAPENKDGKNKSAGSLFSSIFNKPEKQKNIFFGS